MEAFERLIAAQGGDLSQPLPVAEKRHVVTADRAGFITRLDARGVGVAAWRLGAGRAHKEDPVSAIAGVVCLKKEGDAVAEGEPVLELHLDDVTRLDRALAALDGAIVVGDHPGNPTPLVLDRIG
jgi:thymidine phosphorylase